MKETVGTSSFISNPDKHRPQRVRSPLAVASVQLCPLTAESCYFIHAIFQSLARQYYVYINQAWRGVAWHMKLH